jgi:DNA-binding CsgD family transcriptional regulator
MAGDRRLHGRAGELATVGALRERALRGDGGALVIEGEVGTGRSALLDAVADRAPPETLTVLRARGITAESDYAYAGLQRLLRPLRRHVPKLPPAQADALARAYEEDVVMPRHRHLVALATLRLLTGAAADRPVLCCVDDVQWLDAATVGALSFAARRLDGHRIALLFAVRSDPTGGAVHGGSLADLPVVRLDGLEPDAGAALLADHHPGPIAPVVRDAVLRAAAGNPLVLLDLLAGLGPRHLVGADPLPDPLPLSPRIRRALLGPYLELPRPTRRLVLLAAADPELDGAHLVRASALAGLDLGAVEAAERCAVVEVTPAGVRFRRPYLRAAVYGEATPDERHEAHRILAETFEEPFGDRRAWHRAAASVLPDESLAGELEAAADRARARDGYAAAAAVLARSAELSGSDHARARRLTAAASHAWTAGRADQAVALLAAASSAVPAGMADTGEIQLLRGLIELRRGVVSQAYDLLLNAADRLSTARPALAVKALAAAGNAGSYLGDMPHFVEAGRRVAVLHDRAGTRAPPDATVAADFLAGAAAMFQGRHGDAIGRLQRVIGSAERDRHPGALTRAAAAAFVLGDDATTRMLASRAAGVARARGAAAAVPQALALLVLTEIWTGRHASALEHAREGELLSRETGQDNTACLHVAGAAFATGALGDGAGCRALARRALAEATPRGLALPIALSGWAQAFADLSLGRAHAAATRLRSLATSGPGTCHASMRLLSVPHFVEAAARLPQDGALRATAGAALAGYERWAGATGNPAVLALVARCHALLSAREESDGHFTEALRLHAVGGWDFEHARTHLLYAETLRRTRRRATARHHLRGALEVFERCGAVAWRQRTRAELRAAGERALDPDGAPAAELTPQQWEIARLAAAGETNREIAARLYLSQRTVDYHLRRIFTRLGITSRIELAHRFTGMSAPDTRGDLPSARR